MKDELVYLNTPEASSRLVLLHGWGADAEDLIPLGKIIQNNFQSQLEVISLHAPNFHPEGTGRQWYKLFPPDWTEVPSAVESLKTRLKSLATPKVPLEKTVILGFSQGGAMALASGLDLQIAGVIACSSYPHPGLEVKKEFIPPVLLFHGNNDEIVPIAAMKSIQSILSIYRINVEVFDGGHQIPESCIFKMVKYMKNWLEYEESN